MKGTGLSGRITKEDILTFVQSGGAKAALRLLPLLQFPLPNRLPRRLRLRRSLARSSP